MDEKLKSENMQKAKKSIFSLLWTTPFRSQIFDIFFEVLSPFIPVLCHSD